MKKRMLSWLLPGVLQRPGSGLMEDAWMCPTCEHLCILSWQDSHLFFLFQLRLLSLHHLYCCASFIMHFCLTLPVHSAWKSPSSCPCMDPHLNCQDSSICGPKHMILLVQRERCLGKCYILISFFLFMKMVRKGQTKILFCFVSFSFVSFSFILFCTGMTR